MKNKRGYFFSFDALIALLIILGVVLFIKPTQTQVTTEMNLQNDLLSVLSNLKIGEVDNSYVHELIANKTITNLNQSVLEQIGEFYANSQPEAEYLASNILDELDLKQNIGIYFNDMTIAESGDLSITNSTKIWTSRQAISGIDNNINSSSRGYSSRAFLFSENKVNYLYFGGYVGDGNLSLQLGENVISATVEAVFSGNFSLSVNNGPSINYSPIPGTPFEFTISNGFASGQNYLYFNSSQSNLYIAGGFVKVAYNNSELPQSSYKHNLPGIEGFVNLYDSFYVSGQLKEIKVFLNYSSEYDVFLTIGNTTVYTGNGSNSQVELTNSTLASLLDFSRLSNETIPFRFGLENVSYLLNIKKDADVYSVTDLSGSMTSCAIYSNICNYRCVLGGTKRCNVSDPALCTGNVCGGSCTIPYGHYLDCNKTKIVLAKEANNVFIDAVLNDSGNRVGLVGYSTSVSQSNTHNLSNNSASLKAEVNSWVASGNTCICCGINEGVRRLLNQSREENFKSLVVMSDGEANVRCTQQGTGTAKQDAIQAACDAAALGIKVYAVAFGLGADTTTLESIASCGEGGFYFGNLEDLISIYEDIAQEILNAAYYEQTVIGEGFHTSLFPSSYISLEYEKEIPYGLIVSAESENFGSNAPIGTFTLPNNTIPYEAKVVSYSGSKWTSKVDVYRSSSWENVFDLSNYLIDYTKLGDPYVINIPVNKLSMGQNSVNVSLGLGTNLSAGSEYDKIIYSVIKNVSSFSPIVASAKGCIWTIQFEDNTNSTMTLPTNYSGDKNCFYTSSGIVFNNNDAIDYAVFNLLSSLDLNSNGKIETKFEEQDLTINSIEVEGIPFVWETEAQARVWK